MKTRLRLISTLLIFGIVSGCSKPTVQDGIADYLSDLASEDGFSGAVLIAKDGEVMFKEAYGWANRAFEVPNQVDTKFNLGSMNKMFTAVAILQLVQQGKLTVDDHIFQHLPNYPNQDIAERVTIHHLLTHTSGLGDFFTDAKVPIEYRKRIGLVCDDAGIVWVIGLRIAERVMPRPA